MPGPTLSSSICSCIPAAGGAGVGRALCLWLEEQARLAGHCGITLGVEPGNAAALNLYESLGYRPTGATSTNTAPAAPSRVLFYGVTGSGNSTAARAYARATGLPEFSADDDIGWLPGWQQRTVGDQRDIAAGIAARDSWVLDSAYGIWRDVVLPRAELVIGLDYPRWLSLARLVRRSLRRTQGCRPPSCSAVPGS